ncbi:hypothetical protein CBI38_22370 [Rhodococcus oxybenzonivorans]|uniref:Dehydrogenase E1 component domain-containing protein n=1 Tax=Rhodococcus oxybenzonivorans TaxID=1990687 RepID=A0A2S2BZ28_9NOCA|nr:hypothetical protein CBI38_22370 [Rhodococcus oxybenzonivorans]
MCPPLLSRGLRDDPSRRALVCESYVMQNSRPTGIRCPPPHFRKELPVVSSPTSVAAAESVGTPADVALNLYRSMRRMRALENALQKVLSTGEARFPSYPIRGLEATCASIGLAMQPSDYLSTTYRCLGDVVAKGVPLRGIAAEFLGRVTGTSKGKGGSMHLSAPELGLMATTGIVGAGAPIACGLGLAAQLEGNGQVAVTTFGDGATSIGAIAESLNLAAIWNLPLVFVCQNNQWAEHTSISDYTRNTELTSRAEAVGMRAVRVDGFAPLEIHAAVQAAVEEARAGQGPVFVESVTYRTKGHSFGSENRYVPAEERKAAEARDPVVAFRLSILQEGWHSEDTLSSIDADVDEEVRDAMEFARSSDPTPPEEMLRDVYGNQEDSRR